MWLGMVGNMPFYWIQQFILQFRGEVSVLPLLIMRFRFLGTRVWNGYTLILNPNMLRST